MTSLSQLPGGISGTEGIALEDPGILFLFNGGDRELGRSLISHLMKTSDSDPNFETTSARLELLVLLS